MFGDLVKVTPSSKVVGDMALSMVSAGLTRADVEDPAKDVLVPGVGDRPVPRRTGPAAGRLSRRPAGQDPEGRDPITERPGANVPPADLERCRQEAEKGGAPQDLGRGVQLLSHVSQGLCRLCQAQDGIRPGLDPADAGLLLRHAAGPGNRRRSGAGQDPADPLPGDRRRPRKATSRCSSN